MWWQDIRAIPRPSKKRRTGRRRRLKGERGRGTLAKEKPPIFGMLQRGGEVVIRMLENVKQVTIGPLIERTIAEGSTVYTDEYDIYSRLTSGATATRRSATRRGSTPATTTGTGSARCMSTPWKGSGRCCGRGSAPTGESRRRACRCTWGSSSSFTTSGHVARGCWGR